MSIISGRVRMAMLALDAANLLPWLSFLSLADYFQTLYGSNAMKFAFPPVLTSVLVCTTAFNLAFGSELSSPH